ncbi:hypothetical protein MMC22_004482 [Lobaria immixta]|nr:hypothetical protein [Lobaria immixta]
MSLESPVSSILPVHPNDQTKTPNIESQWDKPDIGPRLKPAIKAVYENWSDLTGDELTRHLHNIRARAGATVLDVGCCFGQDLRLLATNGVETKKMYAIDISHEFCDLGFDLSQDRSKMEAKFIHRDISDQPLRLQQLDVKMDIILVCQLLHLFNQEQQILVTKSIVQFSRPGSVVIGYQRAHPETCNIARPFGVMFLHNLDTFRDMWRQVEGETGTKWRVEVEMVDLAEWGLEKEDCEWMPLSWAGINFVAVGES